MKPHRLGPEAVMPLSNCTNCGKALNRATVIDDDEGRPSPGDVSVCISCGHLMVFDPFLVLRNPTDAEMVKIAGDPRPIALQRARRG